MNRRRYIAVLSVLGVSAIALAASFTVPTTDSGAQRVTAIPKQPTTTGAAAMVGLFEKLLPTASTSPQAVVAAAFTPGTCPTSSRTLPVSGYSLAYSDEFPGSALNANDWYYRQTTGLYVGGYLRSQNVSVASGAMKIKAGYEDVSGDGVPDYTGGGLISRKNFGYGYYEICA